MGEPPMVFALCCLRANLFRTHHPSTLYVPTVLRSRRILRSSSWIQNKKPAGNYKSCNLSATCLQAGDHYLGGPWNFVNDIAMIINGCFGPVTILSKLLENGDLGFSPAWSFIQALTVILTILVEPLCRLAPSHSVRRPVLRAFVERSTLVPGKDCQSHRVTWDTLSKSQGLEGGTLITWTGTGRCSTWPSCTMGRSPQALLQPSQG